MGKVGVSITIQGLPQCSSIYEPALCNTVEQMCVTAAACSWSDLGH